jgi:hypothetical protein
MSADLHREIRQNMELRDTEDLVDIWKANDRFEWSDEAFEVIAEILQSRGVRPPDQDTPVLKHEDEPDDIYGLTEEELAIVDDENPPDFYDPVDVLGMVRWLRIAAIGSIVIAVLVGFASRNTAQSLFAGVPGGQTAATVLTVLVFCVTVAIEVVITFLPLWTLAQILRILMQMEFNSRKPDKLAG